MASEHPLAVGEAHPLDTLRGAIERHGCDGGVLADQHPRGLTGLAQRGQHRPGVDGVIIGSFEGEADGRGQRRLALPGLARAQALDGELQRPADGELALELARLVLVAGDEQGPGPPHRHLPAARPRQVGGELRPHPRGAQTEVEHPPAGLPELDLGDGGEHAGGDMGGALARAAALEHRHRHALLAQTPRDGQADDAAADDDRVRFPAVGHVDDASPAPARLARR